MAVDVEPWAVNSGFFNAVTLDAGAVEVGTVVVEGLAADAVEAEPLNMFLKAVDVEP